MEAETTISVTGTGVSTQGVSTTSTTYSGSMLRMKVHATEPPKFSGSIYGWPTFISTWKNVMEPIIDVNMRAHVLRCNLLGDALKVVEACDDNYDEMLSRLKREFGDPRKVTEVILSSLRIRPLRDENSKGFIEYVDLLEKADEKLRKLNLLHEISNSQVLGDIERRLPQKVRDEWAKVICEKKDDELAKPYQFLIAFLTEQRKQVKYLTSVIRAPTSTTPSATSHFQGLQMENDPAEEDALPPKQSSQRRCYNCGEEGHIARNCSSNKVAEYFSCACCLTNEHPNVKCDKFKGLNAKDRMTAIKKVGACFKCFNAHRTFNCPKKERECSICNKLNHHDLLCFSSNSTSNSYCGRVQTTAGTDNDTLLHFMRVQGEKKRSHLNIFFDSGSCGNFITHTAAKRNNFRSEEMTIDVRTLGDRVETLDTTRYRVGLRDQGGRLHYIYAYGTDKVTGDITPIQMKIISQIFPDMSEEELEGLRRPVGEVDLLIGNHHSTWQPTRIKSKGELSVMVNQFGTCLGGSHLDLIETTRRSSRSGACREVYNECTTFQRVGVSVHTQLESNRCAHNTRIDGDAERDSFFRAENLGTEVMPKCGGCRCGKCPIPGHTYSFQEEQELQMIRQGLTYDSEKCVWTATYPWLVNRDALPNNYQAAFAILKRCEKSLDKDAEWKKVYSEQIQDMIHRGAARLLSQEELDTWQGAVHYIPHLAAVNPKSKTTAVRICFNSSQKFSVPGGKPVSLNSCLAKGPDAYLNNILGILCRFREEDTGFQGDIRKMYNSVLLSVPDQMVHRFLWRDHPDTKPNVYAICVVNIGDRPAGAIATECAYMTAEMFREEYPRAAVTIRESSYVDDIIDSVKGKDVAIKLAKEISFIYEKANMHVKEWIFSGEQPNQEEVDIPVGSEGEKSRVLGVVWAPESDVLQFDVEINFSSKKRKVRTGPNVEKAQLLKEMPVILTRRIVMSQVMSIFDPMGLITPITINARFLLRETWSLKLGWDDDLGAKLKHDWFNFFISLYDVSQLTFKRCLRPDGAMGDPMLIIFSDGSDVAYGAAAYVRWSLESGGFYCVLIMSKGRILPLQKMTTPRSEVNGAVVSKRLRCFIQKEMRYNFSEVVHLVDSRTVLGMLNKTSRRFSLYMGTRVGEVQAASIKDGMGRLTEWGWIPGTHNVADIITRGARPGDLDPGSVWQTGPTLLYLPRDQWPVEKEINDALPVEAEEKKLVNVMSDNVKNGGRSCISYFSRLIRLLRTVVRVIGMLKKDSIGKRFFPLSNKGLNHYKEVFSKDISCDDIEGARLFCEREAQTELQKDMNNVSGRFKRLAPVWDDKDKVWRVGERMRVHVPFTWDHKLPILLPKAHPFTILNMWDAHEQGHTGAVGGTLARFRRRYWAPQGGKLAKSVKNACVTCRKIDLHHMDQKMGPIPKHLLAAAPAFTYTGLDLFGPFAVRGYVNKRSTRKAYGVLFVCLLSGAVHIDAADDYSTSGFLQVLRRFGSLRGWPKRLYSDKGSQLTGGSNVLEEVWDNINQKSVLEFSAERKFHWIFSPANSAWRQGKMERLIAVAKR